MQEQEPEATMTPETALLVLKAPERNSIRMRAQAAQVVAQLVEAALPTTFLDAVGDDGRPKCWHFVGYRPDAAQLGKHTPDQLNAPDAPQYQGVIFADGSVAMRWLTARRSTSVWDSFDDMFDVHGHPEYGTEIHWPDGAPQEARDAIEAAVDAHRERQEVEAAPDLNVVAPPAVQASDSRALVVCLDCTSSRGVLVVPFDEKDNAEDWRYTHATANNHRAVTISGWPERSAAIARAQALESR